MIELYEKVEMPLAYVPPSSEPELSTIGDTSRSTRALVLVVDDDRSIRDTLRIVLEDEGYTVVEAPDGIAALDFLRVSQAPAVVLLDLMMPRMSGEDVLREISHDARLASRNAYIVITANRYRINNQVGHLLNDLSVPVVPKPFDMDTLLNQVASAARKVTLH